MRYFLYILIEIILLPISLIFGLLGYFIKLKHAAEGQKIVFVHGWLTSNLPLLFFKRYLESRGFSVYMSNVGLLTTDLNKGSINLKEYIEKKKLKGFILVGFSAGAIVSYLYLQKFDGWKKTKRLICIGAPFKGSPLAYLAFFSRSARQMTTDSKFLKKLNQNLILNRENIVCISAKHDEIVPSYSSKLKDVKHEEVPVLGHVVLQLASKETFAIVEESAR